MYARKFKYNGSRFQSFDTVEAAIGKVATNILDGEIFEVEFKSLGTVRSVMVPTLVLQVDETNEKHPSKKIVSRDDEEEDFG